MFALLTCCGLLCAPPGSAIARVCSPLSPPPPSLPLPSQPPSWSGPRRRHFHHLRPVPHRRQRASSLHCVGRCIVLAGYFFIYAAKPNSNFGLQCCCRTSASDLGGGDLLDGGHTTCDGDLATGHQTTMLGHVKNVQHHPWPSNKHGGDLSFGEGGDPLRYANSRSRALVGRLIYAPFTPKPNANFELQCCSFRR